MGEKSKTLGEFGERIIEKFLQEFGWRGTSNLNLKCNQKAKHNKRTHGIDFFATHNNPLISNSQEVLYVSIKNTEIKNLKSTFIKYVKDISEASNCLKIDSTFTSLITEVGTRNLEHQLLIFWLGHSLEDTKTILPKIGNISKELDSKFKSIHLIDVTIQHKMLVV